MTERYAEGRLGQLAESLEHSPEEMQKVLDERLDYEIGTINELGFRQLLPDHRRLH